MPKRVHRASCVPLFATRAMSRAEKIVFWLALINLCAFVVGTVLLGRDAFNGTARNGRYFLAEHEHYVAVSRTVFIYSAVHTLSLFVTLPMGIVAGLRGRSTMEERQAIDEHS